MGYLLVYRNNLFILDTAALSEICIYALRNFSQSVACLLRVFQWTDIFNFDEMFYGYCFMVF